MRDKPNLPDEKISVCLRESYGIAATQIEFLPLGHDSYAGVYQVSAEDGQSYFVKVKQDNIDELSVGVPRELRAQGLDKVVAPLPTVTDALWGMVDDFAVLVYPFIEGQAGIEIGLTDDQWIAYGAALKQVHDVQLTPATQAKLPVENFVPHPECTATLKQLSATVPYTTYTQPMQQALANFWRAQQSEIDQIVTRAEELGRQLQTQSLNFGLCHNDIHTNNVLLRSDGALFIVDWDQPVFAPKERDLLFIVGGGLGGFGIGEREERLFFEGYGETNIHRMALAYFRYERLVQDLAVDAIQIFLREDVGEVSQREALGIFKGQFTADGLVRKANALYETLAI